MDTLTFDQGCHHGNHSDEEVSKACEALEDALNVRLASLEIDAIEAIDDNNDLDIAGVEGLNGLDIRVGAEVDTEEEEEEDDGGQQEPPTVIDDAPENSCDDNNEVGMDATPSINPEANSLEQWKAILELSVSESVGRVTRDSLVIDPFIADTANALGIPDDGRVVKDKKSRLVFHIRAYYFEEWLKRYQTHISTSFNQHEKPRAYSTNVSKDSTQAKKDRAGQVITRYDCHCKGKKFVRKGNIPGGKSGKPRMKATSFRCDCKSYFNAIYCPAKPQDGKPETTYRIEYFYEHNHEIGDKGGVGKLHKSKAIKERIRAMLLRGMSIQAIMDQLTVDHARFTRLMDNGEIQRLCRDDFITYDDVYNILYAITSKEMRKDNDQLISARLWMEELRNQGYFTYYDQEHGIYHGFSSPWQLQELRKWGDVFCFDGTHHACGRDTYLFSIVVKNRETGFGVPCAFFLTKKATSDVLEGWLHQLKVRMDELCDNEFQPTVVVTDQGQTEVNAIRNVFSYQLRIFYCAWHVLQAWERNFSIKNLGMANLSIDKRKRRKDMVRDGLHEILYAKSEDQAKLLIRAFKDKWDEKAPDLLSYLDRNYLGHESDRRRWMFCYREGVSYGWINTNNYIESWHNTLKKHFFKDKQQRRIDTVIYVLANKAIPHYQRMYIRHSVQVGRMTPARKKALVTRQQAMEYANQRRLQDPEVVLLHHTPVDAILRVQSFTQEGTYYDIEVDWSKGVAGQFRSCSCPDFTNNKMYCKHIALANLELPHTKFHYAGHWKARNESPDDAFLMENADLQPSITPSLTPIEVACHYIDKISSLRDIIDVERPLPNHDEVLTHLRKAAELCEIYLPVLDEHNLNRNRRKQRRIK